MNTFKYAGPPGTGKSTTLLNIVDRLLAAKVQPENIIYTTFTRAGAYEARDRACTRFNLAIDRLPYFRTLHSLCYQQSPNKSVLTFSDWCTIGKSIGVGFSCKVHEEGVPRGHTKGDQLLSLISLAKVTQTPLRNIYDSMDHWLVGGWTVNFSELENFQATVDGYKATHGKIDYNDMLEQFLHNASDTHSDYLIVDEAQDLSRLQWAVIKKLGTKAKEIHIAGDDDQCIHQWNGADPDYFINLPAITTVLPQSYRIPRHVHNLAEHIIRKIPHRIEKTYKPREDDGQIIHHVDLFSIDMSQHTWLLLARNQVFLEQYRQYCNQHGFFFIGDDQIIKPSLLEALGSWAELRSGKSISAAMAKHCYKFMSVRDRITYGFKGSLEKVPDSTLLSIEDLIKNYGLLTKAPWIEAFNLLEPIEQSFLQAAEIRGDIFTRPRIEISTVHGAKGKEADHVVLCTDMTKRTWDAYQRNAEAEHRVWYVGVTRARKILHILNPQLTCHYPL